MRIFALVVLMAAVPAVCETQDVNNVASLSAFYGFGELDIVKLNWGLRCLRNADFNKDGLLDIAVVNNRDSKIEILLQKPAAGVSTSSGTDDPNERDINEINPSSKYKKSPVPISVKAANLVCADLNSDGRPDIAFYGEPAGLYILLQSPDKNKKADKLNWHRISKIKIDDGLPLTTTLESGDINNDSKQDLIVGGVDGIYIIIQKEDGSLAEPVKYPVNGRVAAIRTGDLNGDEMTDLVLITQDSERPFNIRFGQGDGKLGPQIQLKLDAPIAVDIYNYDGKKGDEILVVDAKSGRLTAYKLQESADTERDWPILFYPLAAAKEEGKRDMVVADVDGDKLQDIVISDPGSAQLILYKQIKGIGLDKPVEFPTFADVTEITAGDINGDKKPEIIAMSSKEKAIGVSEYKDGRLTFPSPLIIDGVPLAMQIADADSNKKMDCVYISSDVNEAKWLHISYDLDSSKEKKPYKLALKNLNSDPEAIMVFDADHDDLADILILMEYDSPVFLRQLSKGTFEQIDSARSQAGLIRQARANSTSLANIDGKEGDELIVASQNFARSLVFSKDGKWTVVDQYNARNTENNISAAAAFDIDGKGKPEVLLGDGAKGELQILTAGEDKTYRFDKLIEINQWQLRKMEFAAVNGTKQKNVILFDNDKFAIITPYSKTLELAPQFSYETEIKDGKYANIATGDLNSDGVVDFAMVEYKKTHLDIITLDKNGQPIPATRFRVFEQKSYRDDTRSQAGAEPSELIIADVTGDGKNDLVTITHDRVIVYPQD